MKIQDMILQKEEKKLTPEEIEKLEVIKDIMTEDDWMFKNELEVVIGILEFLDIPEDKIEETYISLISPEVFSKMHPKERL